MLTRQTIEQVLTRRDCVGMHAVGRALVHLMRRQTQDERQDRLTKYRNGTGFRPNHARMGVMCAEFYLMAGFLPPELLAYWQDGQTASTRPRICLYSRQILEEAERRQAENQPQLPGL